jgi:nitric oxide reductase NorQ protein
MSHIKFTPVTERKHVNRFTQDGENIIKWLGMAKPYLSILMGPAGCGKTQAVEEYIRRNNLTAEHVACHPGLEANDITGGYVPRVGPDGQPQIQWVDGPYTRAAKEGRVMLLDEITRLNQQHVGKLMSSLDETRLLTNPESGEETIKINQGFHVIATANPPATGYNTVNLDEALKSRAMIYKFIDKPLCDERATLMDILGGDQAYVDAFMKWAEDLRSDASTAISTRDLCYLAKMVGRGFTAMEAIELNYKDKVSDDKKGVVLTGASAHFEN